MTFESDKKRTPTREVRPSRRHRWELRPGDLPPEWVLERAPELRGLEHNAIFRLIHSRRRSWPAKPVKALKVFFYLVLLLNLPLFPGLLFGETESDIVLELGVVLILIGFPGVVFGPGIGGIYKQGWKGPEFISCVLSDELAVVPDLESIPLPAAWGGTVSRDALDGQALGIGASFVAGVAIVTAGASGLVPFGEAWTGYLTIYACVYSMRLRTALPFTVLEFGHPVYDDLIRDGRDAWDSFIGLMAALPLMALFPILTDMTGPMVDASTTGQRLIHAPLAGCMTISLAAGLSARRLRRHRETFPPVAVILKRGADRIAAQIEEKRGERNRAERRESE